MFLYHGLSLVKGDPIIGDFGGLLFGRRKSFVKKTSSNLPESLSLFLFGLFARARMLGGSTEVRELVEVGSFASHSWVTGFPEFGEELVFQTFDGFGIGRIRCNVHELAGIFLQVVKLVCGSFAEC